MNNLDQMDHEETQDRNTKARSWCFTFNNYSEEEYALVQQNLADAKGYVIGKEIGSSGSPHLQGVVWYNSQRYFSAMKKLLDKCHIEQCKNLEASKNYCKKEKNFITWPKETLPSLTWDEQYNAEMQSDYENVIWKPWQQDIINYLSAPPSARIVLWYWEDEGNVGKSFLVKYIDWKFNAIIANGKQSDIFNQYKNYKQEFNVQPKVALIDIPRSHKEYVCYSTLEKIKDGLIYSGKYEGGKIRIIRHHLIVFANFEPDSEKLSADRWDIRQIFN
jgi:hypothetical protein